MRTILIAALCLAPIAALATGKPPATPPTSVEQNFVAAAQAEAEAAAKATAITGPSSASAVTGPSSSSVNGVYSGGGTSQASMTDSSRSSLYVFPPPAAAAPLPGTVCPKGDSLAWSVGWGFFSYAVSSTRTELECLERWVSLMRATAPAPAQQALLMIPPPPPAAVPVPTAAPLLVSTQEPKQEVKPSRLCRRAPKK